MKRAAIYARVSTNNGHQDPGMQLRELREYCQRRGWEVAGEYVDRLSSAKEHRPELDRLLADCHKRRQMLSWSIGTTALPGACANWSTRSKNSGRSASTLYPSMKAWTPRPRTVGWSSGSSPASRSLNGS